MITLYGAADSRAQRCLWMLEELQLEYKHVPTDFRAVDKGSELMRRNPNGKVPVLEDQSLVVWESLAINLYLAECYGASPFWSGVLADRAHTQQWSFWVMTEVEPPLIDLVMNRALFAEAEQDEALAVIAEKRLQKRFSVLEGVLAGSRYLLGSEFTAADLNVAGVIAPVSRLADMDLEPFPTLSSWLEACTMRASMARSLEG